MPEQEMQFPPPLIGAARLLEFAWTESAVKFTGQQTIFVDGKLLGQVPQLAICQDLATGDIHLYHCDECWQVLAVIGGKPVDELKSSIQRAYRNVGNHWQKSPYTDDEVSLFKQAEWGELCCSVCQRWPWEFDRLDERPEGCICNECLEKNKAG